MTCIGMILIVVSEIVIAVVAFMAGVEHGASKRVTAFEVDEVPAVERATEGGGD